MAVYHHLGGLPELFKAVVDRGFLSLGETFLAALATDDPVTSLFGMALAARRLRELESPPLRPDVRTVDAWQLPAAEHGQ